MRIGEAPPLSTRCRLQNGALWCAVLAVGIDSCNGIAVAARHQKRLCNALCHFLTHHAMQKVRRFETLQQKIAVKRPQRTQLCATSKHIVALPILQTCLDARAQRHHRCAQWRILRKEVHLRTHMLCVRIFAHRHAAALQHHKKIAAPQHQQILPG